MNQRKVAVVAGVGDALGASLVRSLLEAGYQVAMISRTNLIAEKIVQEYGHQDSVVSFTADLTDEKVVEATFAEIHERMGLLDVVVYNAHQLLIKPFLETSAEDFERIWRVNVYGAFLVAQAALKRFVGKNNRLTLVFSGATASLRGGPKFSAFASSKFALRALAQSLHREYGQSGVHVGHIVIDGLIWGAAARELHEAKEEDCIKPEALARTILNLIDQDSSSWTHEIDVRPSNYRP